MENTNTEEKKVAETTAEAQNPDTEIKVVKQHNLVVRSGKLIWNFAKRNWKFLAGGVAGAALYAFFNGRGEDDDQQEIEATDYEVQDIEGPTED